MFLLKKIVAPFLMPVSGLLFLALAGLFCLWFTRKQKTGKVLVTIATLLLGLLSYNAVSYRLVAPLEGRHPPLTNLDTVHEVKWIVVLGGGSCVNLELPVSTYLSDSSLFRLLEGVFIYNRLPGSKLIVSGRSGLSGVTPMAGVMANVATEWGVEEADIVVEAESKDTKDHAIFVKKIVGQDRFIVVTSASRMPRAMALFRGQGMDPIAAPTDYMVMEREGGLQPRDFFPDAGSLEKVERALHEYLGLIWANVRGQVGG